MKAFEMCSRRESSSLFFTLYTVLFFHVLLPPHSMTNSRLLDNISLLLSLLWYRPSAQD